eukprot:283508-Heterocapsa_arctica.AAC.1
MFALGPSEHDMGERGLDTPTIKGRIREENRINRGGEAAHEETQQRRKLITVWITASTIIATSYINNKNKKCKEKKQGKAT